MAEGDYATAVELLFDCLQADPGNMEARLLLRGCLRQQQETRAPDIVSRPVRRGPRMLSYIAAFTLVWLSLLVSVLLFGGLDHYLVTSLFGAGSLIFPLAAALATEEQHPARPSLDRLAVLIAFGWLGISMLWMFAQVEWVSVAFAFGVMLIGSVVVPLLVLLTSRVRPGEASPPPPPKGNRHVERE